MKKEAIQKLILALALLFVASILIATLVGVSQISQEQRRLSGNLGYIERQLDGIETDLSSMEYDLSSMEYDLSSIKSDLSSIKSDLSSMESDLWSIKLRLSY